MRFAALLLLIACERHPAPIVSSPAITPVAPIARQVVISAEGVGGIVSYQWGGKSEDDVAKELEVALSGTPGLKVELGVMGPDEHEEGYWSVKHGETEVAMVMRSYQYNPGT